MKILIIDTADYGDAPFNKILFDFVKSIVDCDIVNYTAIPSRQTLQRLYDAIIISGVPVTYPFDSVESRLPYFLWLRRSQLPVLGICLGHQIIAKLFNAEILRHIEAEDGLLATYIHSPGI